MTYMHFPKEKQIKLEDTSIWCIIFRYNSEHKGNILMDPTTQNIYVIKDFIFDETNDSPTSSTYNFTCS